MININDFIFENVRDTETEGNDIIVSSSNNKHYSLPVLSDCKIETKTGWKRKLSCSAFSRPADTVQFISILTSCFHGITHCCISLIVFLSTNLVSFFRLYPCLTVSVSLSAGMRPFYTRGVSTKTLTARRLGWWNHMLMHFLCCLTVTRARIPNGDLHLISNFNLALENAEALGFMALYNFLSFIS